jgi:hypothetical protein
MSGRNRRPGTKGGDPKKPHRQGSEGGARNTPTRQRAQLLGSIEIFSTANLVSRLHLEPGLTATVGAMISEMRNPAGCALCGCCAGRLTEPPSLWGMIEVPERVTVMCVVCRECARPTRSPAA